MLPLFQEPEILFDSLVVRSVPHVAGGVRSLSSKSIGNLKNIGSLS